MEDLKHIGPTDFYSFYMQFFFQINEDCHNANQFVTVLRELSKEQLTFR